jgi:hypothetical protein
MDLWPRAGNIFRAIELSFAVCDPDMPGGVLAERREKERNSQEKLSKVTERIQTMRDCRRWRFTEHGAYNERSSGFGGNGLSKGVWESH